MNEDNSDSLYQSSRQLSQSSTSAFNNDQPTQHTSRTVGNHLQCLKSGLRNSSKRIGELYNSQDRLQQRIRKKTINFYQQGVIKKKQKRHKQNQFTADQDERILELVREYGPRFCVISKLFTEKSIYAIKNRYYKVLRYKWKRILNWDPSMEQQERKKERKNELDTLKACAAKVGLLSDNKRIIFGFLEQLYDEFH